jgi:hypothetical protein
MREMPYIQPYHVGNRRSGNQNILDARGGRGGRGGNIDNKVFESAITFWFKDVDFDGDKVWEYFHMNN